jgi:hypothetical protein
MRGRDIARRSESVHKNRLLAESITRRLRTNTAKTPDHEEAVDEDVETKCGEGVARVVVVPHAYLHGADEGGVEEEETA